MHDNPRDAAYELARRSYERGRLVSAARHAAMGVVLVAVAAAVTLGKGSLVWLPVTFFTLTFTEWRGVLLMTGARRGFLVGLASILLPLSVLRPCCGIDAKAMGASCCIMPSACWAAGAVVGLAVAMFMPRARAETPKKRLQAASGMVLGVASVAVLRCSMLFLGEAFGLLGGIAAGMVATSLARAWLRRTPLH